MQVRQPVNAPVDSSPYPWSQRKLSFTSPQGNPFPRYGAAVNATGSKDGSIYLMGGLINGSTVKGDLWMVEAGGVPNTPGQSACFAVATTSEGPGPRVGHASLLVGNAFIVFGGDTKMDEGDMLDDTLYLLNTSTKQWSRALPAGTRPPGRYGHSLNILGSKIYIFGGQVEGYFFNDLVAFDLNALQQPQNRWEILIRNSIDGGPPHGQIPPARTNHTIVSWGDRLYLFGGTDGVHWFNDVWSYSPVSNSWQQLECIGYIPTPREGHAAALVGDVMYIFGGRTEEGTDLGDLAAFRISSRRWYTFQNMGPSPSPRSGHSMTTIGKHIMVLAGEPSSAPRDPVELAMGYCLDTSKIRYPPDSASQTPANERIQGYRRPSGEKSGVPIVASQSGRGTASPREVRSPDGERDRFAPGDTRMRSESGSRLPRPGQQSQLPAPSGPPPQQQPPQPKANGAPSSRQPTRPDRAFSPSIDTERAQSFERRALASPQVASVAESSPAGSRDLSRNALSPSLDDAEQQVRQKPEVYQPSQDSAADAAAGVGRRGSRNQRSRQAVDRSNEATPRGSSEQAPEILPKVNELQHDETEVPQDSGIGSTPLLNTAQYDDITKELEQVKQRNAWYASELALARKSGYQTRSSAESPALDTGSAEAFSDDDRPLIEALLKMRTELVRVQETIDEQAKSAAAKIAEVEKQRDSAISEAVFAKAKLAGQGSETDKTKGSPDGQRQGDISKRLAVALNSQSELQRRIDGSLQEIESERKARRMAEDIAEAAQRRVTEVETSRQQHSSELESLRSELHEAQVRARDVSASYQESLSRHKLLSVDKEELDGKLESALAETQNHSAILISLREAVSASTEKAELLQQRLDQERTQRENVEQELGSLRLEHDSHARDLESSQSRLREAEELAIRNAEEARTHRAAVMAGLDRVANRSSDPSHAVDERVTILQQQVEAANAMVRSNQEAADNAGERLRKAEERIAGLEAYQEQASREGLSIRKQLQAAMKDAQALSAEKADLEQKLQSQLLETNAIDVQHRALKDILGERGINASEVRRSRALDSPSSMSRFSTPDLRRVQELEQQLEATLKSHEDMKIQFEEVTERDDRMKKEYEEKLTALDNDHQAAVKYLRGTEKMLSKMKQELQRIKNENGDLRKKLEKARVGAKAEGEDGSKSAPAMPPAEWEAEREKLKSEVEQSQASLKSSVAELEAKITTMQTQLSSAEDELNDAKTKHEASSNELLSLQAEHGQSRTDIERLQKENASLEERAKDAENKVQLLLDQVESSVDNYRRQSRLGDGMPLLNGSGGGMHQRGGSGSSNLINSASGHTRTPSDGAESTFSHEGGSTAGDARDSLALDSLANELDALRTHWETTNKNYRLSDKFDFERTPNATSPKAGDAHLGSLANWRSRLDIDEDDDKENSRPGSSETDLKTPTGLGPATAAGTIKQTTEDQTPGGMI
ncbi:hypothetical protein K431DRAFT_217301 [Polychaeton citri CBS 116435]|uniref:Cell polarity protein n=1 Tax=Polychaeton citri CBS 116435 TaxID=1314669 RepID=A0A9P4QH10_9PEZI|nr:hypothetical protein K431DRAFT_217301 [Polychaeton citri CBS 116435]